MLPLPIPQRGGKIASLRRFLNVRDETDFALAVAWLLAALRDVGPYPVLALVRRLYTDMDETLFDATRPIILNGIE